MGFFNDMGLIGKVYKHLNAIEEIINAGKRGSFEQDNVYTVRLHLNELIEIANKNNRTIDFANFEFTGRKYKLDEIIYILDNFLRTKGY